MSTDETSTDGGSVPPTVRTLVGTPDPDPQPQWYMTVSTGSIAWVNVIDWRSK